MKIKLSALAITNTLKGEVRIIFLYQVREPYSVVGYLASRLDLPEILHINLEEEEESWSAYSICSGWAELRRYTTARTSRPDTYR